MKTVSTPNAPLPAGHYSQAMVYGGLVYVAGQLPIDPRNPGVISEDPAEQTRQALANVSAILQAAGSALHCVVQMTIYVTDVSLWPTVNATYSEVLGEHRPARAIVPVGTLKEGMLIEIQAIAGMA